MRQRILETAWGLFLEKGYDNTTVDEIIKACGISKGGFYHHFSSKEDLLIYLSDLFDAQYKLSTEKLDRALPTMDKLFYYTENLFRYIEDNIPCDVLALVLSTQVTKNGAKYLLDERRIYFTTLSDIMSEGQAKGEVNAHKAIRELVKLYAMEERAILYDWCLCTGQYPLSTYGLSMFKAFMSGVLQ